jgi:hypothetical protein
MYSTQLLIAGRTLREIAIQNVSLRNCRTCTCRDSGTLLRLSRLTICQISEFSIAPFYVNTITGNVIDIGDCCS